jgi:hypothetical protein
MVFDHTVEIKTKHILIIILCFFIYNYCCDIFKQPSYTDNIKSIFNNTLFNATGNSSWYEWIETSRNQAAGVVSVSTMAILNSLPVSLFINFNTIIIIFCLYFKYYIRNPRSVLYAAAVGSAGALLNNLDVLPKTKENQEKQDNKEK